MTQDNVNLTDQFETERQDSDKFRISGKITNIFQNSTLSDAGSGSFALNVSGSYDVDITLPGYKSFLTPILR